MPKSIEERRAKYRENSRRFRDRCIAANLCSQCGRTPSPGGKQCATCRDRQRERRRNDVERHRIYAVAYLRRVRDTTLAHYGGRCACCGESIHEFLTIDHIDGNGMRHRRELGITAGYAFAKWLRDQGYPPEYQVLCWNCNMGKGTAGGICPHQG